MICERVDEVLTEILEGTADAELQSHAQSCARCRALIAEIRGVERLVASAGDDLIGASDPAAAAKALLDRGRRRSAWSVPRALAAAALVSITVGTVGAVWWSRQPVDGAWEGAVDVALGAGLSICAPDCLPAKAGDPFPPGARLQTDADTRSGLRLVDGTTLVLDRGTTLTLDARRPRSAHVASGQVLADVSHIEGSHALLSLPHGEVTVLGTELLVGTIGALGEVAVTRGAVSVQGKGSAAMRVTAGQTAAIEATRAPTVGPRTDWSDLPTLSDLPEDTIRGLGQLTAKRPGAQLAVSRSSPSAASALDPSKDEVSAPLRLARHHTTVRASGPVAVTEVEEVFANDSDETLEGIFRFPLPADADIEALSLEVDGELVLGAFTPRNKARAIWKEVVTEAKPIVSDGITWYRDPALLEWQRGGRFELRIFPINPHSSRRVIIRYSQIAPDAGGTRRLQVPLPSGGAPISDFALDVSVVGHDPALGVQSRGYVLSGPSGRAPSASEGLERETVSPSGRAPSASEWASAGVHPEGLAHEKVSTEGLERETVSPSGRAREKDGTAWRGSYASPSLSPSGDLVLAWALADRSADAVSWAYLDPSPKMLPDGVPSALDPRDPFVAIAVKPTIPAGLGQRRRTAVVVDRSRSMSGERFTRAVALASEIVARIDEGDDAIVLACDATCEEMPGGPVFGGQAAREAVTHFLSAQSIDGASDPIAAIEAAQRAGTSPDRTLDVVWMGDGIPTVGPVSPAVIEAAARDRLSGGRVFSVPLGIDADTDAMSALARATGGAVVPYIPGQRLSAAALSVLCATWGEVLTSLVVQSPEGMVAVIPPGRPVRAGEEIFVFGRLKRGSSSIDGSLLLSGVLSGAPWSQSLPVKIRASGSEGNAFVPRLYAGAQITALEARGAVEDLPEIEAWSTQYRVASRSTSLLVLESDAMFAQYDLDRFSIAPAFSGMAAAESETAMLSALGYLSPEAAGHEGGMGGGLFDQLSAGITGIKDEPLDPSSASSVGATRGTASGAESTSRRDTRWYDPSWYAYKDVWVRRASLQAAETRSDQSLFQPVAAARAAYEAHAGTDEGRTLLRALLTAGQFSEASDLASSIQAQNPIDADMIIVRSDAAALLGDRATALRILGGLADVRPDLVSALEGLSDASGHGTLGCDASIARAELRRDDGTFAGAAIACAERLGWRQTAAILRENFAGQPWSLEAGLAAVGRPETLSADVWLHASWSGDEDLDLSLLGPDGRRYSWVGPREGTARTRWRGVAGPERPSDRVQPSGQAPSAAKGLGRETASTEGLGREFSGHEAVSFRGLPRGVYRIDIARTTKGTSPIDGTLQIALPGGGTDGAPFHLDDGSTLIGWLNVGFDRQQVDAKTWRAFRWTDTGGWFPREIAPVRSEGGRFR